MILILMPLLMWPPSFSLVNPMWFPTFIPNAFTCPCGLVGRLESMMHNERPLRNAVCACCLPGMGWYGISCCVFSATLNFCLPMPLSPIFGCFAVYQRWKIMDQFNIDGGCMEISKGCCYPCALFQQFVFLDDMRKRRLLTRSVADESNMLR